MSWEECKIDFLLVALVYYIPSSSAAPQKCSDNSKDFSSLPLILKYLCSVCLPLSPTTLKLIGHGVLCRSNHGGKYHLFGNSALATVINNKRLLETPRKLAGRDELVGQRMVLCGGQIGHSSLGDKH